MSFDNEYSVDKNGVIYQKKIEPFSYDNEYLSTYKRIKEKCVRLSEIRLKFIKDNVEHVESLLDFGSGTGEFLEAASKSVKKVYSYDVIPKEFTFAETLTEQDIINKHFDVVCFFDSLEHVLEPENVITSLRASHVCISLPWCHYHEKGEEWFMKWKHRKPNEHLFHFNNDSLCNFMDNCGYTLIKSDNIEDVIRTRYESNTPNILSAIFKKKKDD